MKKFSSVAASLKSLRSELWFSEEHSTETVCVNQNIC